MHTSYYVITDEQEMAEKKARLAEKRRQYRINRMIKDEVLDITGYELGWKSNYQANMNAGKEAAAYAKPIFTDTDRWGRLMQMEMRKKGLTTLTPEIVKKTEEQIGEWAMRGRGLLVSTWAYGFELGKILGWTEPAIKNSRKNYSNQVVAQHIRD